MLEIKGRILQRTVYIPEEEIECEIVVTNKAVSSSHSCNQNRIKSDMNKDDSIYSASKNVRSISSDELEKANHILKGCANLAYISAQIVCFCEVNERKVKLPELLRKKLESEHMNNHTSLNPRADNKGYCLCTTQPTILCCDLKVYYGEAKKFRYKQQLLKDHPPSYKGQNIKFSYKILIGIGRINQPLCILKLPFRLLEFEGIYEAVKGKQNHKTKKTNPLTNSGPSHIPISSPFLTETSMIRFSKLDIAMDKLTSLTVKRNLNTYNIQSSMGIVGKFCLSRHYYRLGEDILGSFDFTDASLKCFKYTVTLQTEEVISRHCLLDSTSNLVHRSALCCYEECCYISTKSNFILHIPVTATPEFTHKIVSLRWSLRFEFTIGKSIEQNAANDMTTEDLNQGQWLPSTVKTETMLWDLPLHVVATNPIQASLMMQAESLETLILPTT